MKCILVVLVFMLASCGKKHVDDTLSISQYTPDSMALYYNNKASVLIGEAGFPDDSLDMQLFDSAVFYLDKAIKIDSVYLLAYANKSQALRKKGALDDALEVLKKIESIRLDGAVIASQGFILEKMGKMEQAEMKYKEALRLYEEKLENDPENEIVQSDIAFMYIFLEGKDAALEEIHNSILNNPDGQQLKQMEAIIKSFDREEFIDSY